MRAGAPVWVGCPELLEPLGMGTEGQGQPLGTRAVSMWVAMPQGEQMVLLAPCLLFPPFPPRSQPVGLGHSCRALPRARPRAGLGEVTAAAPRAGGRGVGCAAGRGREGAPMRRGWERPEWPGI